MKKLLLLVLLVACTHAGEAPTVEVKRDDLVIGVEVTGADGRGAACPIR